MPDAERILALVAELKDFIEDFTFKPSDTLMIKFKLPVTVNRAGSAQLGAILAGCGADEATAEGEWLRLWWD